MQSKLRRRIATSPIARGAAFPLRTMAVARYDAHVWRACSKEPHWARRVGWHALVRATQRDHAAEMGTHLGLGSCVIAAALLRNVNGRLTTIDIDPEAGYLIAEPWASVIDRRSGSSVDELVRIRDVGMFIHDSLYTYGYETSELVAVEANLLPDALILSDNAHDPSAMSDWVERSGRHYPSFEEPPSTIGGRRRYRCRLCK